MAIRQLLQFIQVGMVPAHPDGCNAFAHVAQQMAVPGK